MTIRSGYGSGTVRDETELNYYIEDSWDDGGVVYRDNTTTGYYIHRRSSGLGTYLKGVYRPEWYVVQGNPGADNGRLRFPRGDSTEQMIRVPCDMVVGTWEFDLELPRAPSDTGMFAEVEVTDNTGTGHNFGINDYPAIYVNNTEDVGPVLSADVGFDGPTRVKAERTGFENWELFRDGASVGTVVSPGAHNAEYMNVTNAADTEAHFDDLLVY